MYDSSSPRSGRSTSGPRHSEIRIYGAGLPPIMVLHGGPGLGYQYLLPELRDGLGEETKLIFYDQRASGQSTGSADPELLTISTFVEDVRRVCQALAVDRAVLLGHSFGGLLALHVGLQHPELVAGLILVDSDPASQAFWARYPERLRPPTQADSAELAAINSREGWQREAEYISRYFELALKPFFANSTTIPVNFGHRFAATPPENLFGTSRAVRSSLGDWDLHPKLKHLQVPVQVIVGDHSIFPPEAMTQLCESLPQATMAMLSNVAHFPPIESPAAFQRAVRGFLDTSFKDGKLG